MRIRAGIVLIQENKVALIERHRAGLHYFVFPGGGVNEGESPEQAAIRETFEELGVQVVIQRKVAEVQLGKKSRQIYFLVEQTGGEFGTGTGEEFSISDLNHPQRGIYIPVWMSVDELPQHTNIYPAELSRLVVRATKEGWPPEPFVIVEESK